MKIRWRGLISTQHSWAFVSQSLIRAINNIGGHELYIKSTNGLKHFPEDLKPQLLPGYHNNLLKGDAEYLNEKGEFITVNKNNPLPEIAYNNRPYDLELSYTIFYQSPRRFFADSKARAIIWNFESSIMPPGWHLYHKAIDYYLPSSQYSFDIFADNGVPKDKMLVVPHGVDTNIFNPNIPPFELKTQKKIKFLHNAIPHHRKLHEKVIKGYFNTFTDKDDVCLILKTKFLDPKKLNEHEVDVQAILKKCAGRRKDLPEIEIIQSFIPDIGSLYTACDAVISMSSCEGFWLPGLEALACGSLVIAPRHGGQLEFLNDDNSILIDTKEMKAPSSMQYWTNHPDAVVGDPDIKHFSKMLWKVYKNLEKEKQRIKEPAKKTVEKFTWEAAAQMILDLPIPKKSKRIFDKDRVLFIVPYLMAGGAEVWVRDAINSLDKNIYEIDIAFVNGLNDELVSTFKDVDAEIIDLSNQGRGAALKCLMESGSYSVVHFYNSFAIYNIIGGTHKQGLRAKIVETVHSELKWRDSMSRVATRLPFVSEIIGVSKTICEKLKNMGNKNVSFVPQPINWERFKKEKNKEVLKADNIPSDFVVGFVGRLSTEKNLPVLLQVAAELPEVSFVIIGSGAQRKILENLAKNINNIFFLGRKENVEDYYCAFDALILPSTMEGMPLVILEAMASGTPILASRVGAIPEVVMDNINGNLISNSDYKGYIEAIKNLLNKDLWNRYSQGSLTIASSIEEESKEKQVEKIYNKLLGK